MATQPFAKKEISLSLIITQYTIQYTGLCLVCVQDIAFFDNLFEQFFRYWLANPVLLVCPLSLQPCKALLNLLFTKWHSSVTSIYVESYFLYNLRWLHNFQADRVSQPYWRTTTARTTLIALRSLLEWSLLVWCFLLHIVYGNLWKPIKLPS